MAGPRSPGLLHYLYKVIGCFIPRSGSPFLVPDPCSSFRIPVSCSGSPFLVPDPRFSFQTLVPCSGSSFLVPDITLDLSQSHATCQNNPHVLLYSVTGVCTFRKNSKTPKRPSICGQVNIFNHVLETITFFLVL